MEIPIYENHEQVGTLRASQEGLYTLFAARLPHAAGADAPGRPSHMGLSRLWLVNKNGKAASLGVLEPCMSGRVLSRRLTRLECRRLPSAPERALILPDGEKPALPGKQEEGQPGNAPRGEKMNAERRIPHSELAWRRLSDGSLIDSERRLLALPWAGGKLLPPARKIMVDGREYWAFRY